MSVLRPTARATARAVASLAVAALVGAGLVGTLAAPAAADTAPPAGLPATVSADALPTTQINGVVWQQALVGDTVYAGGDFTRARPAGAAAGSQEVVRNNLLSFDVRTGVLNGGWAPNPNGGIRAVVRSPDGRRVYVGGTFTSIAGQNRYRIAAFDTATGALVTSFTAGTNSQVRAIAATNTTVYVGGIFTDAGGSPRSRLAAFDAANGRLLPWAPTADDGSVSALTVSPDGRTVIVGGNFRSFNGSTAAPDGLARVDAVTGASLPFPATTSIRNGGSQGSILGLSGDADHMYGVGYTFGRDGGTLEGVFAADWDTGALVWVADCHGDTYAVHPQGDVVYTASHHHYCGNVGGTPQFDEWEFYRANAMTKAPTGRVGREPLGYANFEGQPAPTILNWYPDLDTGTYTGQNQGPWAVTGDSRYIVMGGEFLNANFRRQQGLVRFAVRDVAPNDQGPRFTGANFTPTARAVGSGAVRVSWRANADFDNERLTYTVLRDGRAVWSGVKPSVIWNRPTQGFTDTGLAPGSTHTYAVRVADPFGNTVTSPTVSATADGTGPVSAYALAVQADGASHHWRLGESSGAARDAAGTNDAPVGTGVTRGTPGAIAGDPTTASTFAGSTASRVVAPQREQAPNEMSVEAWVRTTSTRGGWVVGFGTSSTTANSSYRDRQLYLDSAGRVQFGASPGQNRTVRSPGAVNDGQWHHLVGTMGAAGMRLYVDGALVASRDDNRSGRNMSGFWRIGGDTLGGWPNLPASNDFAGALDEVAVYPHVLPAATVAAHHQLRRTGTAPAQPPVAALTATADGLAVAVDGSASADPDGTIVSHAWAFGDGRTATGPTASHTYAEGGTYRVTLTVTDDAGQTAQAAQDVTVAPPPPNRAPVAALSATPSGLAVSVDGSASTDPDGTVTAWAWDFGDGGTATGATAAHTYAAAGTYAVTLTVTDDAGATATARRDVTVRAPDGGEPFAADAFGRTVAGGWGGADVGGAWAVSGGAANFSVAAGAGAGAMRVTGAGYRLSAGLPVAATSTDLRVDVGLDVMPTGSGTDLEVVGRALGGADGYRARLKVLSTGVVRAALLSTGGGTTATLAQANVPGLTYAAGQTMSVRLQVDGTGTTALRLKVWPAGTPEPTAWTLTASDTTASSQVPGGVGLSVYTSATSTTLPLTARWSGLRATAVAP